MESTCNPNDQTWRDNEVDRLRVMAIGQFSPRHIAEELGKSEEVIKQKAEELGIPLDPNLTRDITAGKTYEMDNKSFDENMSF